MLRFGYRFKNLAITFPRAAYHTATSSLEKGGFHSTTVLNVRKGSQVAMIADGQISLGPTVFKNTAKKIRKI